MRREAIKYLGIDWGGKRIGLAIGDSLTRLATPAGVVFNLKEIKKLIKTEEIAELVIGLPLDLPTGTRINREFNVFRKDLKNIIRLPIHEIDERLSSKQADSLSGDKKTKATRDAIAAMIILQSFLDQELNG